MTYCMTNLIPSATLEEFFAVDAELDFPTTPPPGLLARQVGTADGGVVVVALWESKAHADRFSAEQLAPAVQRVHGDAGSGTVIAFEVESSFDASVPAG